MLRLASSRASDARPSGRFRRESFKDEPFDAATLRSCSRGPAAALGELVGLASSEAMMSIRRPPARPSS